MVREEGEETSVNTSLKNMNVKNERRGGIKRISNPMKKIQGHEKSFFKGQDYENHVLKGKIQEKERERTQRYKRKAP